MCASCSFRKRGDSCTFMLTTSAHSRKGAVARRMLRAIDGARARWLTKKPVGRIAWRRRPHRREELDAFGTSTSRARRGRLPRDRERRGGLEFASRNERKLRGVTSTR